MECLIDYFRLEIDPYDTNNSEIYSNQTSNIYTSRLTKTHHDKENDESVINNLKTAKRGYDSKRTPKTNHIVTPRAIKYPPTSAAQHRPTPPMLFPSHPSHRRNTSSQFQPYMKPIPQEEVDGWEEGHTSFLGYGKTEISKPFEEESNFDIDDMDEAQSRVSYRHNGGGYAAKHSYKHYLENQEMGKKYLFLTI
jgi:hypothetical protein